jgi:hypothetical protein
MPFDHRLFPLHPVGAHPGHSQPVPVAQAPGGALVWARLIAAVHGSRSAPGGAWHERNADRSRPAVGLVDPGRQHVGIHGLLHGLDAERRIDHLPGGQRRAPLGSGSDGLADRHPGAQRGACSVCPWDWPRTSGAGGSCTVCCWWSRPGRCTWSRGATRTGSSFLLGWGLVCRDEFRHRDRLYFGLVSQGAAGVGAGDLRGG